MMNRIFGMWVAAAVLVSASLGQEAVLPRLSPRPREKMVDLTGTWKFNPAPGAEFWKKGAMAGWSDIQVPGEWAMQGFTVKPKTAAGYMRSFTIPKEWSGQRVKLRCDAVYSDATVWINGREAGRHLGGFTPFELDVTDLVKPGENRIALAVKNESLADVLASGNQYAAHPLGGIPRKLYLFAVPEVNIASLHAITTFDKDYRDATLKVEMEIANEGKVNSAKLKIFILLAGNGGAQQKRAGIVNVPVIAAGETIRQVVEMPVIAPDKWDPEHPNLYVLTCDLLRPGKVIQTVSQKIGFRQVEVRGNQVFVNNMPIKLRGVCRHEVHPTLGRALTPELWRKDAEIFRAGNCNFIRTSHYPPAEEFIAACDEVGLLVELEAPLCWVGHDASKVYKFKNAPKTQSVFQYLMQCNLETVEAYYNHPSVIIHSLANESKWTELFARVHKAVREADPSRPVTFHDQCWGDYNSYGSGEMPIGIQHYPGPTGPAKAAKERRPIDFGEFCHLNAYNRHELVTDPGVRDAWGIGFAKMWENMRQSKGCLGGSLWAAIDDSFFVPPNQTVGYGTWGPIDGWRRLKPEFWHMKKVYSPVRVTERKLEMPGTDNVVRVPVENRHLFTNLKEIRVDWKVGDQKGSMAGGDISPGKSGILEIPLKQQPKPGVEVALAFSNALGVELDREVLVIGTKPTVTVVIPTQVATVDVSKEAITLTCGSVTCVVDCGTGRIVSLKKEGKIILTGGPHLMVLPLNGEGGTQMHGVEPSYAPFTEPCGQWKVEKVDWVNAKTGPYIEVKGTNAGAEGQYTIGLDESGLSVTYRFKMKQAINPRQVGMVFDLPRELDRLKWKRNGQWTVYPEDHIGRLVGTAVAFPKNVTKSGPAGPRTLPKWNWSQDCNELGSNDFRSTKFNILQASVIDASGTGLGVNSDGTQHVRAWVDKDRVRLAVLDYANAGAERFFRSHAAQWDKPLKKGDVIEGFVPLEVLLPK